MHLTTHAPLPPLGKGGAAVVGPGAGGVMGGKTVAAARYVVILGARPGIRGDV